MYLSLNGIMKAGRYRNGPGAKHPADVEMFARCGWVGFFPTKKSRHPIWVSGSLAYTTLLDTMQRYFPERCIRFINHNCCLTDVEHSHEAIIDPEEWERVQLELARRKNSPRRTHCNSPFAGKLICGDCGEIFGSKVWHSTSKYRRTIWQCNAKFKGEEKCRTPHLYEDDLKQHFITALSMLITNRDVLLDDLRTIRAQWLDFHAIEKECEDLLQEMDVVSGMIKAVVNENASMEMSQAAYTDRYNTLVDRFEKSQSRYDELQNLKERRQIQADEISGCLFALYELDLLELEFNDALRNTVIRHVVVYTDEHLIFHFKTGHEISVKI